MFKRWIFSILNCLTGLLTYWDDRIDPAVEVGPIQKSRAQRFIVATVPMWETIWKCQDQLLFTAADEEGAEIKVLWPFVMLSNLTMCMNALYRAT